MKTKTKTKQARRHPRRPTTRLTRTPGAAPHATHNPAPPGATPHEFLSFAYYPGAIDCPPPPDHPGAAEAVGW